MADFQSFMGAGAGQEQQLAIEFVMVFVAHRTRMQRTVLIDGGQHRGANAFDEIVKFLAVFGSR
jgi:hypothetical protein